MYEVAYLLLEYVKLAMAVNPPNHSFLTKKIQIIPQGVLFYDIFLNKKYFISLPNILKYVFNSFLIYSNILSNFIINDYIIFNGLNPQ